MGERLYQRKGGRTWYGWYYDAANRRRTVSLHTHDKRTAQLKLRKLERAAHGEDHSAADAPPYLVITAMTDWLAHGLVGKSAGTRDYYGIKSGHINRVLGQVDVNALSAKQVAKYIDTRRDEGASQHTIAKEATTLRQCLRWAQSQGHMVKDPRPLVPEMKAGYVPRKRFLTAPEFERLLGSFKRAHRRAWLQVAVYTGGRQSEIERLAWSDVDLAGGWLELPGTKTTDARRQIPIGAALRPVLESMLRREDGLVVGPWAGCVEDLRKKCLALDMPKVSPNDLRRTFASWLVQAGVPLVVVAKLLGHRSTVMVERVYGHLVSDNLRSAVDRLPGPAAHMQQTSDEKH